MIVREIDRPTPMPVRFVVTNGWNSWSATSGEIPPPVSETVMDQRPSAAATRRASVRSGVASAAWG